MKAVLPLNGALWRDYAMSITHIFAVLGSGVLVWLCQLTNFPSLMWLTYSACSSPYSPRTHQSLSLLVKVLQ